MVLAADSSSTSPVIPLLLLAVVGAIVVVAVRRSKKRDGDLRTRAVVALEPTEHLGLATIGSRIGAMLIDLTLTAVVLFFAVGILQGVADLHREQLLIAFILVNVVAVAFYGWRVGLDRTVGQHVCGIRIVDKSTQAPIGTARALGRIVVRPVSLMFSGLGFLWAIWDADRQTWHDKIVDSVVVSTSAGSHRPQTASAPLPPLPPPSSVPGNEVSARLRQLDELLAHGLITPSEHAARRTQVLDSL